MPTFRQRSATGTPWSACCKTAVICSTEKRFFFTAQPPGRCGPIVPQTHPGTGLKKPVPLTVLYGDQRLSPAELEVLHTPAMQRLHGLRQLGLADRVFIDASHSRIHHVVGVLEQAGKLVSAIAANLERSDRTLRFGSKEQHHTFS